MSSLHSHLFSSSARIAACVAFAGLSLTVGCAVPVGGGADDVDATSSELLSTRAWKSVLLQATTAIPKASVADAHGFLFVTALRATDSLTTITNNSTTTLKLDLVELKFTCSDGVESVEPRPLVTIGAGATVNLASRHCAVGTTPTSSFATFMGPTSAAPATAIPPALPGGMMQVNPTLTQIPAGTSYDVGAAKFYAPGISLVAGWMPGQPGKATLASTRAIGKIALGVNTTCTKGTQTSTTGTAKILDTSPGATLTVTGPACPAGWQVTGASVFAFNGPL